MAPSIVTVSARRPFSSAAPGRRQRARATTPIAATRAAFIICTAGLPCHTYGGQFANLNAAACAGRRCDCAMHEGSRTAAAARRRLCRRALPLDQRRPEGFEQLSVDRIALRIVLGV